MIPVRKAIRRIRRMIHDEEKINYSDEEIKDVLNAGLRVIRRSITEIQPEIIMTVSKGVFQAGEREVILPKTPTKIIEMTAGDRVRSVIEGFTSERLCGETKPLFGSRTPIYSRYEIKTYDEYQLREVTNHHIRERQARGRPYCFYRYGARALRVYPCPERETGFTVRTVYDIEEMSEEDATPLNSEFDDFLLEYAATRLAVGNEYDMMQEQQLIGTIHNQIAQILSPPPVAIKVRGYW